MKIGPILALAAGLALGTATAHAFEVPPGAQVSSSGASTLINFPDGSSFAQTNGALNVHGGEAMAWFLANTTDAGLKALTATDVLSISLTPGAESYQFADGTGMVFTAGAASVGGGLAAHYHGLMSAATKKAAH